MVGGGNSNTGKRSAWNTDVTEQRMSVTNVNSSLIFLLARSMAAFAGWRERPGQQGGTDLAKPSWPRGNIYAETQEAM